MGMRTLLFVAVAILGTFALGVWFMQSMVPSESMQSMVPSARVVEIDQARRTTLMWPLAVLAWGAVLIRRPVWLSVLLFCAVGFVGGVLAAMGGLFVIMGGGAGAREALVVGVVMLAACAFMLFRSIADDFRRGRA